MDIKSFEEYLRQSNMAENTISAYLYAIKEFYSRHKDLNKKNLLIYKTYRKHSKKCTFYTLRFGCSFAAVNTIKPQLL